jgi:hypothetical protein
MIPLSEQIACVQREIAMRERLYPRWVTDGKKAAHWADKELAGMRAVLATLEAVKRADDDGK